MNHFKVQNKHVIGTYKPSENWSRYIHVVVMDEKTNELLASVGYYDQNDKEVVLASIEQANLYANAPAMLDLLEKLSKKTFVDDRTTDEILALINNVKDIREPAKRLLNINL